MPSMSLSMNKMFKVGDKVKVVGCISSGAIYHHGQTIIIDEANISKDGNPPYCLFVCIHGKCGAWNDELKLIRLEPKTETEVLDAFKYNFEDGV